MRVPTRTTHKGYDFLDWTGETYHPGVDYNWGSTSKADLGQPVYPFRDGRVHFLDVRSEGFGNQVVLRHRDGSYSRYAHLQEITVEPGAWVSTFQEIGKLGDTGATGNPKAPHLHFEAFDETVWSLGARFYPNGKSKEWVQKHYFDPNKIKPRTLRVKVLANRLDWSSWQEKFQEINKMFDVGTTGQLQFDISLEATDFDETSLIWDEELKNADGKKFAVLNKSWFIKNCLSKAVGYDICVLVLSKENWGSPTVDAYALGEEYIDGIQSIVMHSKENGKRRGGREFEGRLSHEICHSIVDMTGIPDTVHLFDYREPSELLTSLHKVRFEDIRGWDADGVRLFKWVDGHLIQKIVSNQQSSMFQSGIEYWLKKGGYKLTF